MNREYQVACRDVLMDMDPTLQPFSGDGIDVAFDFAGSTWKLDVALKTPSGALVLAECQRQKAHVNQEQLRGFSSKLEDIRRDLGLEVERGYVFAKTKHQEGAVLVGARAHKTSDPSECLRDPIRCASQRT